MTAPSAFKRGVCRPGVAHRGRLVEGHARVHLAAGRVAVRNHSASTAASRSTGRGPVPKALRARRSRAQPQAWPGVRARTRAQERIRDRGRSRAPQPAADACSTRNAIPIVRPARHPARSASPGQAYGRAALTPSETSSRAGAAAQAPVVHSLEQLVDRDQPLAAARVVAEDAWYQPFMPTGVQVCSRCADGRRTRASGRPSRRPNASASGPGTAWDPAGAPLRPPPLGGRAGVVLRWS